MARLYPPTTTFTDSDADNTTGWITDTSFTFRGLRASTTYYARVSAQGQMHGGSQIVVGSGRRSASIATETFDHNGELDLSNFSAFWQLESSAGFDRAGLWT